MDAKVHQLDLLNGSKERVSEAEYWAKRRGQLKLDRKNAALIAAGQQPKEKKFETAKEILRRQITDVLGSAASFEEFSDRLISLLSVVFGRVRPIQGRTLFLFVNIRFAVKSFHKYPIDTQDSPNAF